MIVQVGWVGVHDTIGVNVKFQTVDHDTGAVVTLTSLRDSGIFDDYRLSLGNVKLHIRGAALREFGLAGAMGTFAA